MNDSDFQQLDEQGVKSSDEWMPDLSRRFVVCAACRHPGSGRIIAGPRHWDKVMREHLHPADRPMTWEQGVIDQFGLFLTREEAWEIAVGKGQIRRQIDTPPGTLYSEHLY